MNASSPLDRRRASRDRRDAPRAPLVAAVRHAGARRFFLSQDLSPRGMTVLRPGTNALAVWSPLEVEFELPGGRFVRAIARVAHDREGGRCRRTGLEFLAVTPKLVLNPDQRLRSRRIYDQRAVVDDIRARDPERHP